jgi:hypothetical protein
MSDDEDQDQNSVYDEDQDLEEDYVYDEDEDEVQDQDQDQEEPYFLGEHYLYDGFWYYYKFPVEWAKNHSSFTGPNQCGNCRDHGSVHDETVFVGYCLNCAVYEYDGMRGPGMKNSAISNDEPSLLDPDFYLYQVNLDTIPKLMCDVSPPDSDADGADGADVSILECHFEGGYNDF